MLNELEDLKENNRARQEEMQSNRRAAIEGKFSDKTRMAINSSTGAVEGKEMASKSTS